MSITKSLGLGGVSDLRLIPTWPPVFLFLFYWNAKGGAKRARGHRRRQRSELRLGRTREQNKRAERQDRRRQQKREKEMNKNTSVSSESWTQKSSDERRKANW